MAGVTTYSTEVADKICERIALGESLRRICTDAEMPAQSTVFKWLKEVVEFSEQYAHARDMQAETMMDDILEIADNTKHDTLLTDFGPKPNADWIARSKLMVETRLKLMAQLAPKRYGAKVAVTMTDGNPFDKMTDEEIADELRKYAPPQ